MDAATRQALIDTTLADATGIPGLTGRRLDMQQSTDVALRAVALQFALVQADIQELAGKIAAELLAVAATGDAYATPLLTTQDQRRYNHQLAARDALRDVLSLAAHQYKERVTAARIAAERDNIAAENQVVRQLAAAE